MCNLNATCPFYILCFYSKRAMLKRANTVKSEIKAAPQKFVIPKENRHNSAFSFGITNFWCAVFISDFTVFVRSNQWKGSMKSLKKYLREATESTRFNFLTNLMISCKINSTSHSYVHTFARFDCSFNFYNLFQKRINELI